MIQFIFSLFPCSHDVGSSTAHSMRHVRRVVTKQIKETISTDQKTGRLRSHLPWILKSSELLYSVACNDLRTCYNIMYIIQLSYMLIQYAPCSIVRVLSYIDGNRREIIITLNKYVHCSNSTRHICHRSK